MYKGIIIFGTMGSGKDTLADMLIERMFMGKIFKLGEDIRKTVDKAVPGGNNRKLYQDYGQAVRNTLGIDAWNNICKSKIDLSSKIYRLLFPIIADGRQSNEATYWRNNDFYIVGIEAQPNIRYERLIKRDGSCDKDRMLHETEYQAQYVATQISDYTIYNNCSMEYLRQKADEVVEIVKE